MTVALNSTHPDIKMKMSNPDTSNQLGARPNAIEGKAIESTGKAALRIGRISLAFDPTIPLAMWFQNDFTVVLIISDSSESENGETRSWIQTIIADSGEALQSAIDETAETHRMLVRMKGILAITKHRMNKKNPEKAGKMLVKLCMTCEKQVSMITHLLSLRLDMVREEESLFDKILEYAELWSKNKRGCATLYEKSKVVSMEAEIFSSDDKAMNMAREAEIAVAVERLKEMAAEFQLEGKDLEPS